MLGQIEQPIRSLNFNALDYTAEQSAHLDSHRLMIGIVAGLAAHSSKTLMQPMADSYLVSICLFRNLITELQVRSQIKGIDCLPACRVVTASLMLLQSPTCHQCSNCVAIKGSWLKKASIIVRQSS